jgi:hypothetical protein
MPQKRNPDVFELMRGRSAVAQAALNEVLGITQKLTSGYHRDLQLIKPPLFRGIDSCLQTSSILPSALDGVRFRPENIRLDPAFMPRPPRMPGGQGRHSLSRSLPASGRQTQGPRMSIWRSLRTLERRFERHRKAHLVRISASNSPKSARTSLRGTMPVDERTRQPFGLLHGGASVALAETLGSTGATMCVDVRSISAWARKSTPTTCARRAADW